jgi:hypothetical protein
LAVPKSMAISWVKKLNKDMLYVRFSVKLKLEYKGG